MSFFRRKGPYDIDPPGPSYRSSRNADGSKRGKANDQMTREGRKLTALLILNTLLAMLIYFGCVALELMFMIYLYLGLAAVLLIVYVVYNRGFALRDVTPDMLPDSLTLEQKQAKLDEAARRLRDSRWLLTVIVPLIITVMFDAIYLFLLRDLMLALGLEM